MTLLYYVVLSVQPFPCICRPAPGPGLISFSFRHLLSPRSPHGWAGPGVPRTARAAALLRTNVLRSCCGIKDAPSQRPVLFLSPPTAHRPTDNSRGCSPSPHAHLHARRGIPTQQNGDPRGALTAAPAAPDGGGGGGRSPHRSAAPSPPCPGCQPPPARSSGRGEGGREGGREAASPRLPPPPPPRGPEEGLTTRFARIGAGGSSLTPPPSLPQAMSQPSAEAQHPFRSAGRAEHSGLLPAPTC